MALGRKEMTEQLEKAQLERNWGRKAESRTANDEANMSEGIERNTKG